MKCALCQINYDENNLNFHHLIPKSFHNNKRVLKQYTKDYLNDYGVYLCKSCHNKIHSCINEKNLAFTYNTIEKLKQYQTIKDWINWKHKHPNFINTYNRKSKCKD